MPIEKMIRRYKTGDEVYIGQIFYDAVHQLAAKDYTAKPLDAWASLPIDFDYWQRRCKTKQPLVNKRDGRIIGFLEIDTDGHIDCAYVDPAHAGRGVMSEIMTEAKRIAANRRLEKLFAEVSKTAVPFFKRHDFVRIRDNTTMIRGIEIENVIMECNLETGKT